MAARARESPHAQSEGGAPASAPLHRVPVSRIVSIEHPCIVCNFENGLKSLGGEAQLKHVLEHHVGDSKLASKQNQLPEPVAGVSLRPHDPFAKKLPSVGVETRNALVKVTLPKRTGRKRKRGPGAPFEAHGQSEEGATITASDLLRRLRDNEATYTTKVVGMLRETHRFRTLPDFQLRNAELPIMRELRGHVMMPDFERMKSFNVDLTPSAYHLASYPGPPSFASFDMPHKYEYQQASGVIYIQDGDGNITTKNLGAPPKRVTWNLPPDIEEIPMTAPNDIPDERSGGREVLPRAIRELQRLLETRPLITKRVALNALPPISETIFKEATQFVGYSFKAGPWRDSLIKYGVDPRKDPKYRFYQTMMFQVDREAFKSLPAGGREAPIQSNETNTRWARPLRHTKDDPTTHIFDGKNISANGKTWQVCDISDPIVHKIFQTENLPTEADVYQWGWYHNGTIAKARVIMKDKMKFLFAGEEPPHHDYEAISTIPDKLSKANIHEAILDSKKYGERIIQLTSDLRTIVKTGDGSKRQRALWSEKQKDAEGGEVDGDTADLDDANEGEDGDMQSLDVAEDGQGDFGDDMHEAADDNESGGDDDNDNAED